MTGIFRFKSKDLFMDLLRVEVMVEYNIITAIDKQGNMLTIDANNISEWWNLEVITENISKYYSNIDNKIVEGISPPDELLEQY